MVHKKTTKSKAEGPNSSASKEAARAYRPSAKLASRMGSGPLLGPLAGRVSDEGPNATPSPAPVGSIQEVMAALRIAGEVVDANES